MKRFTLFLFFSLILAVLFVLPVFAQLDTTAVGLPPLPPAGFNWFYIAFFALGMVIHFLVTLKTQAGGWSKFFLVFNTSLPAQFLEWFGNKFHFTLIAGAAALVGGVASEYGLNINFAVLNSLGIAAALVAGYIGDSAFNKGVVTPAPTVVAAKIVQADKDIQEATATKAEASKIPPPTQPGV